MKRYKVATCTGHPIIGLFGRGGRDPGCTASVLDTAIIHREVARFRSEDILVASPKQTRGIEGAIEAAQAYADALNAGCEPASAS